MGCRARVCDAPLSKPGANTSAISRFGVRGSHSIEKSYKRAVVDQIDLHADIPAKANAIEILVTVEPANGSIEVYRAVDDTDPVVMSTAALQSHFSLFDL